MGIDPIMTTMIMSILMDIDHIITATIMITVEECLGQHWIILIALGWAGMIHVILPVIMPRIDL